MAPMPWGTGYVGHSDAGQIFATFAEDGTMKATYNVNLKRLEERSKTTSRKGIGLCDAMGRPDDGGRLVAQGAGPRGYRARCVFL